MAVIQNATLPEQKVVTRTAIEIYQLAIENQIASPAIIIIGNVVDERILSSQHAKELIAYANGNEGEKYPTF